MAALPLEGGREGKEEKKQVKIINLGSKRVKIVLSRDLPRLRPKSKIQLEEVEDQDKDSDWEPELKHKPEKQEKTAEQKIKELEDKVKDQSRLIRRYKRSSVKKQEEKKKEQGQDDKAREALIYANKVLE